MGIKIKDILITHQIDVKDLAGKIIAVDGPNIILQLLKYSHNKQGFFESNYMLDGTRRIISHLYGLLYRISFYYSKKMFPIFCFDGKIHPYKRLITKDQLHDFQYTRQRYFEAINAHNIEQAQQIATGKEFMWINTIQEAKKILSYMGVPYIDSPASAESQCAALIKGKVADLTISQDFDCIVHGCSHQIQNLSKSRVRKINKVWQYSKIPIILIKLNENLKNWGVDIFQLVDMVMLIGTDYNNGIKGIGPKLALRLIKKFGNIESVIINNRKKYDFSALNEEIIGEVRKIFLFPEVLNKISKINWKVPQIEKISEFLCEDHTLNSQRVKNNTEILISNYKKCVFYFEKKKLKIPTQQKIYSYI